MCDSAGALQTWMCTCNELVRQRYSTGVSVCVRVCACVRLVRVCARPPPLTWVGDPRCPGRSRSLLEHAVGVAQLLSITHPVQVRVQGAQRLVPHLQRSRQGSTEFVSHTHLHGPPLTPQAPLSTPATAPPPTPTVRHPHPNITPNPSSAVLTYLLAFQSSPKGLFGPVPATNWCPTPFQIVRG